MNSLDDTHFLSATKAFSKDVNQSSIDIIDRLTRFDQFTR